MINHRKHKRNIISKGEKLIYSTDKIRKIIRRHTIIFQISLSELPDIISFEYSISEFTSSKLIRASNITVARRRYILEFLRQHLIDLYT